MPGPFTHIYTARRVAEFLQRNDVTEEFIRARDGKLLDEQKLLPELLALLGKGTCAAAMNKWEKFTAVGAIGPDLFFFLEDYSRPEVPCDEIMLAMSLLYFLDDQGILVDPFDGLLSILATVVPDGWGKILRFLVSLHKAWLKFLEVWNETIGPIVDAAGQVIDDLLGGLLTALGDAFTELKNDLINLVEGELFTSGDIFSLFSLNMRTGCDEQAYLWSDMMHYRRTSVVPARLIAKARDMMKLDDKVAKEHGEQLLAFALGWVCHVGTDVIAHSFVNEQCGGPFRTHWQRHHLIENMIDGWNYECTNKDNGKLEPDDFVGWLPSYPSIADSALYFAVQIPQNIEELPVNDDPKNIKAKQGAHRQPLPEGNDKASQKERDKRLDTDGALPVWLADTIAQTLIEVFADPREGGDNDLSGFLGEPPDQPMPHPLNLEGQSFQDRLKNDTSLISSWLGVLGVEKIGMGLEDLRNIIAPDPPQKKIPEGFPFPWEIRAAYRFMLSFFKKSYISQLNMDRPEPPSLPGIRASDTDFGPPDASGVNSSDDPISQTCELLAALLDWVFKTLEKTAQLIYDIVKNILSAVTMPAKDGIYYGITLPAWEVAENIRMVLVHLGYAMPQSQKLYTDGNLQRPNEIDETLIMLGHSVDAAFQQALACASDVLGNLDADPALNNGGVRDVLGAPNPWLPVREAPKTTPSSTSIPQPNVVEFQRPWAFPDKNNETKPERAGNFLETPLNIAGPYPTDTKPDHLLQTTGLISNPARTLYQDAGCSGDTDKYNTAFIMHQGDGRFGEDRYNGTNPLGDPVNFSAYLMGQLACNPSFSKANFNLDADRGYGYLCWDWTRDKSGTTGTDKRGHTFPAPVTWPEGAGGKWIPDAAAPVGPLSNPNTHNAPLNISYYGRKGCKETDGGGDEGPPR